MVNIPRARDTQNAEKEEHTSEQYPQGKPLNIETEEEKKKKN